MVIIIAPFAALEPYNAVAAAPLSTLISAMSSGLISDMVFPVSIANPEPVIWLFVLINGDPSTTNNTWLFPDMER